MTDKMIYIDIKPVPLHGHLVLEDHAKGLIIFSFSGCHNLYNPRYKFIAEILHNEGFGTLLTDLLTDDENIDIKNRFNIELLAGRLLSVMGWIKTEKQLKTLPAGLFGAGTGAASAIQAASLCSSSIRAIVMYSGRPDLGRTYLSVLKLPVLLIVGEMDKLILELNRESYSLLKCTKSMEVIPNASHLFEESGVLEQAARIAGGWFQDHLTAGERAITG